MIQLRPPEPLALSAVLSRLDLHDQIEAELIRGRAATGLELFADWWAMRGAWVGSHVFATAPSRGAAPFAVGALVNTGQAGVAQAALLARDHARFRRPLAELALRLAVELPEFCQARGIHRVEARCWAAHPSAPRFLTMIGFAREVDMPGFGADGSQLFSQFALYVPPLPPAEDQPQTQPGD
jgi:hypothetical protein